MTPRALRLMPDPVLRMVCEPVTVFDGRLRDLTDEMFQVMYDAPGRGLAAPQIGVVERVFVMDEGWKDGQPEPQVFINPQVVAASSELTSQDEGCLSIPGRIVQVTRPAEVSLRWQDLDGSPMSGSFTGFGAACVQHEIDHLDGVLCIDHVRAA